VCSVDGSTSSAPYNEIVLIDGLVAPSELALRCVAFRGTSVDPSKAKSLQADRNPPLFLTHRCGVATLQTPPRASCTVLSMSQASIHASHIVRSLGYQSINQSINQYETIGETGVVRPDRANTSGEEGKGRRRGSPTGTVRSDKEARTETRRRTAHALVKEGWRWR
jgi:hypothetical protein